jgi:prepilin-type N-terminal cleavage/methylation domain-containing protein
MRRSPVKNQGWTLIEMAVVAVIAGILSALAIPSMVGMQGRSELRDATNQVKAALQEAQRNAIKSGRRCRVLVNSTLPAAPMNYHVSSTNSTQLSNDPGTLPNPSTYTCISSPVRFPNSSQLSLTTNIANNFLPFSYRGNTNLSGQGTIVISSGKTSERRCVVISNFLGVIRTGIYTGTPFSGACNSDF